MSIEVKGLEHIYSKDRPDEHLALSDVSFSVEDGEVLAIIGHTGSGKSTLLQHLNGLLKPTKGQVIVDGFDVGKSKEDARAARRKVGLVFQYPEYQLFEETVRKDVAFGPKNLGASEAEIEMLVDTSLKLVGLDPCEVGEKSPFELSGGQKRRVAIAGVIAMKPAVLVLDEPTAGLDPGSHRDILNMIRNIHEKEKNIVIFVSHNMDDVAEMADKVLVMDKGRQVMLDVPEVVFSKVDELKAMGLDVPKASKMARTLRKSGFDMPDNILFMDQLCEEILSFLDIPKEGGSHA